MLTVRVDGEHGLGFGQTGAVVDFAHALLGAALAQIEARGRGVRHNVLSG